MNYLKSKRRQMILIICTIFILFIITSSFVKYDFITSFLGTFKAFSFMIQRYFPIEFVDTSYLISKLIETLLVSIAATTMGTIFAYIFALVASAFQLRLTIINYIIRLVGSITRNVPGLIWALVFVVVFWSGDFIAFLTLFIITFGFLLRAYLEMFNEVSSNSLEALQATGASYLMIVTQAIIPETLPIAISWALYSFEVCVRTSTIIGLVTGSGLGYVLSVTRATGKYNEMMGIILIIGILVMSCDIFTTQIRKRLL